jgi:predicted DNA binding CopG/RHH family protein
MEENMKNKFELTEEEKQIESEIDRYKSVSADKKKKIEKIIDQTKKNKAISLRINNYDLEKIKEKAEKEGVPYQTLITNILHKYISDQLYDKDQVFKTIKLLKKEKAI